jgi:hypothetical protein
MCCCVYVTLWLHWSMLSALWAEACRRLESGAMAASDEWTQGGGDESGLADSGVHAGPSCW